MLTLRDLSYELPLSLGHVVVAVALGSRGGVVGVASLGEVLFEKCGVLQLMPFVVGVNLFLRREPRHLATIAVAVADGRTRVVATAAAAAAAFMVIAIISTIIIIVTIVPSLGSNSQTLAADIVTYLFHLLLLCCALSLVSL
jgi:hypothetical protein